MKRTPLTISLIALAALVGSAPMASSATKTKKTTKATTTKVRATTTVAKSEPATTAAKSEPATTAAPASKPLPSGTLRIGVPTDTATLDPQRESFPTNNTIFPLYDTLTSLGDKYDAQPWLSTSWTKVNATTWRFTLRKDVTFHDGSAFDASVVKANFDRGRSIATSPYRSIFNNITSVTVLDPFAVQLNLAEPSPNLPFLLAGGSGAMISGKAIAANTDLTRTEAGSGGWIWDRSGFVPASKQVLRANPNYWNRDAVRVGTIEVYLFIDVNARLNALQSGQIDMIGDLPAALRDAATRAGAIVKADATQTNVLHIIDRAGKKVPALADDRVRFAIGLLIDRTAYNRVVENGYGNAEQGGFARKGSPFYADDLDSANPSTAQVDKAKELLAAAGYPDGFAMDLPTTPAIALQTNAIAQMLREGGIRVNQVTAVSGTYTPRIIAGDFPAYFTIPSSIDLFTWWRDTVSNKSARGGAFKLNDLNDLETRYQVALETSDVKAQAAAFADLQRDVLLRGVMLPLSGRAHATAYSKRVNVPDNAVWGPDDPAPRPFFISVS